MKRNATVLVIILLPIMISSLLAPVMEISGEPSKSAFINRMNVNAGLLENSSVRVTIIAEILVPSGCNGTINSIAFPVVPVGIAMENPEKGIQNYKVLLGDITVKKIKTESFSDVLLVKFLRKLKPGNATNISFTFTLKPSTALVRLSDSRYRFAYRMYMPNITVYYNTSTMRTILPYGAGITKVGSNGIVEMDSLSDRLTAVWKTFGPPRGAGWDFILEFKILNEVPVIASPETTSSANITVTKKENFFSLSELMLLIIISNIITGASALAFYKRAIKRKTIVERWTDEEKELTLSEEDLLRYRDLIEKLDRDERDIVNILMSKNGKMEQKELPGLTGFSKSKVSRMLKRLDSLGVVKRTSLGKTKMIELNPALKEVLRDESESHAEGGI